jgi:hypothetical protein
MRSRVIVALALACAGCASATRGWNEQLTVASTPSGATATVKAGDTPTVCVTPCAVQVKRADDVAITFTKDGYEPEVVTLTKELQSGGAAGFAGNLLLGGVVGMVVDGASNAAYDHKPNPVTVVLRPVEPPAPVAPPRKPKKPPGPPVAQAGM